MAARDVFHQAVRVALEKEGWLITHDPLSIPYGATTLYIDLGAERLRLNVVTSVSQLRSRAFSAHP